MLSSLESFLLFQHHGQSVDVLHLLFTAETKRETPTLLRAWTLQNEGTLDLSGLWLGEARQGSMVANML